MSDVNSGSPMFEQPDFGAATEEDFDDEIDETAADDAGSDDVDDEDEDDDDTEVDEDDSPNRVSAAGGAARAVVGFVTESLVDDPSAVVVETSQGRSGERYSVHVAPGDMGRVIGRKGRTVQALRTLVRAAAATEGRDASVEVVD